MDTFECRIQPLIKVIPCGQLVSPAELKRWVRQNAGHRVARAG
jgi:hypothetical protein